MLKDTVTTEPTLTTKLRTLRDRLLSNLVERDVPIRLALLAAIAGEHLLLVGPPGTAKSLVARRLGQAFIGTTYFERLLTRFTVPEELFGPLSIKQLEQDRYVRQTGGYLPTAQVAFIDEIFKANSAILNALLTLLNEREFDNGTTREKAPLIAVIAASNELPDGAELAALYDRFLLRLHVGPVTDTGFDALLGLSSGTCDVPPELRITAAELDILRRQAVTVVLPEDVKQLLKRLRAFAAEQGVAVSDRRWRKIVGLLQASAASCGRDTVSMWDGWLLQHCTWDRPEHREAIFDWYLKQLGADASFAPDDLEAAVAGFERRLSRDRAAKEQRQDLEGRPLFVGTDGKPTPDSKAERQRSRLGGGKLYLAPTNAEGVTDRTNSGRGYTEGDLDGLSIRHDHWDTTPFRRWDQRASYLAERANWYMEVPDLQPLIEPKRFGAHAIAQRLAEADGRVAELRAVLARARTHRDESSVAVRAHLWTTDDFVEPAHKALAVVIERLSMLENRMANLVRDIKTLPTEGT